MFYPTAFSHAATTSDFEVYAWYGYIGETFLSLGQGYTTELRKLHRMNWNPRLGEEDFEHEVTGHFKPQMEQFCVSRDRSFAPDVAAEIEKLCYADLLAFSFLMWFSLPVLSKGWADRVFAMGVEYSRVQWWYRSVRD